MKIMASLICRCHSRGRWTLERRQSGVRVKHVMRKEVQEETSCRGIGDPNPLCLPPRMRAQKADGVQPRSLLGE